jgi:hypothetical protein
MNGNINKKTPELQANNDNKVFPAQIKTTGRPTRLTGLKQVSVVAAFA